MMRRALLALLSLPMLGMGFFPGTPKQRIVVLPSACPVKLELEMLPPYAGAKPTVLARGLSVGDCVEVDALSNRSRLCCPAQPRTCGALAQKLAKAPACKRVVKP